jgi:cation:H+ antiporter
MGHGGMAVGNALGSCIANIGLILAIAAIIRAVNFNPRVIKQELVFLIAMTIILYILILDGKLSFGNGLFLCFLLVAFFAGVILRELKAKKENVEGIPSDYNIKKDGFRFLIGAAGVVLSAKYAIIPCGINIAHFLGLPEIVIGLSMVALGTSLPELVTAVVASIKGMGELAVGNVIGANILNILWVLGCSCLINPLNIDGQTKGITLPIALFITLLMFLFSRTKFKLSRNEGLGLFAIYAGYIFYIFRFAYNS